MSRSLLRAACSCSPVSGCVVVTGRRVGCFNVQKEADSWQNSRTRAQQHCKSSWCRCLIRHRRPATSHPENVCKVGLLPADSRQACKRIQMLSPKPHGTRTLAAHRYPCYSLVPSQPCTLTAQDLPRGRMQSFNRYQEMIHRHAPSRPAKTPQYTSSISAPGETAAMQVQDPVSVSLAAWQDSLEGEKGHGGFGRLICCCCPSLDI